MFMVAYFVLSIYLHLINSMLLYNNMKRYSQYFQHHFIAVPACVGTAVNGVNVMSMTTFVAGRIKNLEKQKS